MKIFQLFQFISNSQFLFSKLTRNFCKKIFPLPNLTKILVTFRLSKNCTKRWRRDRSMHSSRAQSKRDQSTKNLDSRREGREREREEKKQKIHLLNYRCIDLKCLAKAEFVNTACFRFFHGCRQKLRETRQIDISKTARRNENTTLDVLHRLLEFSNEIHYT